jgi:hypothetical protein
MEGGGTLYMIDYGMSRDISNSTAATKKLKHSFGPNPNLASIYSLLYRY